MEKMYRVEMNSKGMPNFATAKEVADRPSAVDLSSVYSTAYKSGYEKGKADRPQGEWIRTGRTNIYGGIEVQCSNCGDRVMVQHLEDEWYCRHCGADMGMKGADDE